MARRLRFLAAGGEREVEVRRSGTEFRARLGGREVAGSVLWEGGEEVAFEVGGRVVRARVERRGEERRIRLGGESYRLKVPGESARGEGLLSVPGAGTLTSSLPGRVVEVRVREEQVVEAGAILLVVEAMKMEHFFRAEAPGRVVRLHVSAGDDVTPGDPLIELAPPAEARESAPPEGGD
ncbi:MAG: biotin/lipoyl-binding protein [Nitrospinota bacterium]